MSSRKKANVPKWTPEQEALLRKARHEGCLLFHDDLHALGLCANAIGKTNGRGNRNLYNDFCAPLVVYGTNLAPVIRLERARSGVRDGSGTNVGTSNGILSRVRQVYSPRQGKGGRVQREAQASRKGVYWHLRCVPGGGRCVQKPARPIASWISQEMLTDAAHCGTRHEIRPTISWTGASRAYCAKRHKR